MKPTTQTPPSEGLGASPRCISRGIAPLTEVQETFSQVLAELADGSTQLPIQVFKTPRKNEMTYVVLHNGVALTLHVQTAHAACRATKPERRRAV